MLPDVRAALRGTLAASGLLALMLIGGCQALQAPEAEVRSRPGLPVWDRLDVREHLEFLNSSAAASRAPGSEGMATAAEYVAARMRGHRLQPVYHSGFRMPFNVPEHRIESAVLAGTGADSTALSMSYDFFPDGRSDSGSVAINFVHLAPSGIARPFDASGTRARAIMLRGEAATPERLIELAASGFRLALLVQELEPVSAARPISGLVVMQVTPRTAAWILGVPRATFGALWEQPEVSLRSLPRQLRAVVETSSYLTAETVNVAGYIAGRHPALARDLVIVAANLDTHPLIAGERVSDFHAFGIGLSALLEVARNEVSVSRRWPHPMRTLMFVALQSRDASGLAELLRVSPWEAERISGIIYIGLREEDEADVRTTLSAYDIPLEIVAPPPDALFERRYAFASRRSARSRSPLPPADERTRPPDSSTLLSRAMEAVVELADAAHASVQRHAGIVPTPVPEIADETRP